MRKFLVIILLACGQHQIDSLTSAETQRLNTSLSADDRQAWAHLSQGVVFAPASLWRVLETPTGLTGILGQALDVFDQLELPKDKGIKLISDEMREQVNHLPGIDPEKPYLFYGFAERDFAFPNGTRTKYVGFNCAACHTQQITYQGREMIIEGGRGVQDIQAYGMVYVLSLMQMKSSDALFNRLTEEAYQYETADIDFLSYQGQIRAFLELATEPVELPLKTLKLDSLRNKRAGHGRVDAIHGAMTTVFGRALLDIDNYGADLAPVRIPAVWGTQRHTWQHWTGLFHSPLHRDMAQDITSGAPMSFQPASADDLSGVIQGSGLLLGNLMHLEDIVTKITPPKWPFGELDEVRLARGREIYQAQGCESCHGYAAQGEIDVHVMDVGTDLTAALTLAERQISLHTLGVSGSVPGYAALEMVLDDVERFELARSPELADAFDAHTYGRDNQLRALLGYKALPLDGVWSRSPYGHNAAFPTLDALLSPENERPDSFCAGGTEYDPVNVGYVMPKPNWLGRCSEGMSLFKTSREGNDNHGHTFGTDLNASDRRALIEYLKSL